MRAYKTIFPFLKKYRLRLFFGVLTLIFVDAASLLMPQILGIFADEATAGTLTTPRLLHLIGMLAGLVALMAVGRYFWRMEIFGTSERLAYWLRDQLFRKYLILDQSFYNQNLTGDLMAHVTNDVLTVSNSMGQGLLLIVDSLFMTVLTIIMMVWTVGLRTTAIALCTLPFLAVAIALIVKPLHQRNRILQNTFSDLTSEVQENLSGVRVIKAFGIEDNREESFDRVNRRYEKKFMDTVRVDSLFDPTVELISGLSFVIFIIYGSRSVANGAITIGSFVVVIEYLFRIVWPLIAMGLIASLFQRGISSMQRINEILNTYPVVKEPQDGIELSRPQGRIEFDSVRFRYGEDLPWVLDGISFTLEPGKSLAILGKTGMGKTTLIRLLQRRYDVTEGIIRVDGYDIRQLSLGSLFRVLSVVAQESVLFSRTIGENIAFSSNEPEEERIHAAAQFAQIESDILQMNDGYETMVGERGVTLSGGQKQRIAIARAYYKNAPVMILDDSLSAVDTETESRILEKLRAHHKGLIMISQRVSTVSEADEILVLENGKITQRGTHDQLVKCDGFYKELYERQLLENKIRDHRVEGESHESTR